MSEAAMQAWLPNVEAPNRRTGIYPAQWYQGAFQRKEIVTRRLPRRSGPWT